MLSKLGKYEIRRELGRGAMGVVYEGYDPFIQRTVAIKTIQKKMFDRFELEEALSRFRREAQAAGRLSHPGVVGVYEYGEEGDIGYIAMEFVVGSELKDTFDKDGKLSVPKGGEIMLQVLDALDYSHKQGVVHRDIKPANILITREGRVKIADFGIARIESSELTRTGTVLGTPYYMAPEQFLGEEVGPRSDIYAAGVILYQLLTGVRPFTGDSMIVIMNKVLKSDMRPPRAVNRDITPALEAVVIKAMARQPRERFQTAGEFANALRQAVEGVLRLEKLSQPARPPQAEGPSQAESSANLEKLLQPGKQFQSGIPSQEASGPAAASGDADSDLWEKTVKLPAFNLRGEEAAPAVAAPAAAPADPLETTGGSSLLAGLAREAQEKEAMRESAHKQLQANQAHINEALDAISKFFYAFVRHVNSVAPEIPRIYPLDGRTLFNNLKWLRASVDTRKLDSSEAAPLVHADIAIRLSAPEPVLLKRPWGDYEQTVRELQVLKLDPIEDLRDVLKRGGRGEMEVPLSPEFTVHLLFAANFEKGWIDVSCRNLGAFGVTRYRLLPSLATPAMLDELGLFLLGRSNKLPAALQHV